MKAFSGAQGRDDALRWLAAGIAAGRLRSAPGLHWDDEKQQGTMLGLMYAAQTPPVPLTDLCGAAPPAFWHGEDLAFTGEALHGISAGALLMAQRLHGLTGPADDEAAFNAWPLRFYEAIAPGADTHRAALVFLWRVMGWEDIRLDAADRDCWSAVRDMLAQHIDGDTKGVRGIAVYIDAHVLEYPPQQRQGLGPAGARQAMARLAHWVRDPFEHLARLRGDKWDYRPQFLSAALGGMIDATRQSRSSPWPLYETYDKFRDAFIGALEG